LMKVILGKKCFQEKETWTSEQIRKSESAVIPWEGFII